MSSSACTSAGSAGCSFWIADGIPIMTDAGEDMLEKSIPRISRLDKAEIMGYEAHCHSIYGDIRFRAPEVLSGKHYDFKADSWSFGVILFQILSGKLPFDGQDLGGRASSHHPSYPGSENQAFIEEQILSYDNFDGLQGSILSQGHSK
jgi:serine/threonine protein kinase